MRRQRRDGYIYDVPEVPFTLPAATTPNANLAPQSPSPPNENLPPPPPFSPEQPPLPPILLNGESPQKKSAETSSSYSHERRDVR